MFESVGWSVLVISATLSFFVGALLVVWYLAIQQTDYLLSRAPFQPKHPRRELNLPLTRELSVTECGPHSGSEIVDQELAKVLALAIRDYVQSWYHPNISIDQALLDETRTIAWHIVAVIGRRCQEPDMLPLFAELLIDILINHLQLYKNALSQTNSEKGVEKYICEKSDDGWGIICSDKEAELTYARGVMLSVMNLLLPAKEFSSPLLLSLAQEVAAEHVLLPTVHYMADTYYINSTLVSVCNESSLTGESFFVALSYSSPEEIALANKLAKGQTDMLRKKGKTEHDQQQLSSLTELTSFLQRLLKSGPEVAEVRDELLKTTMPLLTVKVPTFNIMEGRMKHAHYHISVRCEHRQMGVPVEQWETDRKFSDVYDFHLSLKNELGAAASNLPYLPSQTRAFNKVERSFLEGRREGIEKYLQEVTSEEFLAAHPQIFVTVFKFISKDSHVQHSSEIGRTVARWVDKATSIPRSLTREDSLKLHVPSPLPQKRSTLAKTGSIEDDSLPPMHSPVADAQDTIEDEEESGLAILLTLLNEVFDVSVGDQWLRRQLSVILRQLLASAVSDKMGRRITEVLDSYASAQRIADSIAQMREALWPGGYLTAARKPCSQETKLLLVLLARSKLIGSIPDDLRRLLGPATTSNGISRLFSMFQSEQLNVRLLFRVLEALLCSMFPDRDLAQAFSHIRTQIQSKHKQS